MPRIYRATNIEIPRQELQQINEYQRQAATPPRGSHVNI